MRVRKVLQALVCALFVAVVGCHLPLSSRSPVPAGDRGVTVPASGTRTAAGDAPGALSPSTAVVVEVGEPEPVTQTQSEPGALPPILADKPHGTLSIAVKWPAPTGYRTQGIPESAQSLRVRVIGSNGKNRLAVMFFRAEAKDLAQARNFFLPVETGLLVEVRAYAELRGQLATTSVAVPPFNPKGFEHFDMKAKRVLAEGFQFNVQISLLNKTPVKVTVETSQLVAGIGGSQGRSSGGDPYLSNFYSTARFAELWDPAFVHYDRGQERLYWVEFPTFPIPEDPKERDLIRMLNKDGLTGAKDDDPSVPVLFQVAGGDRILQRIGDNNTPGCAFVTNVTDLAWTKRAKGNKVALYLSEASASGTFSRIRRVPNASDSGIVTTEPTLQADGSNAREFLAVSPAFGAEDEILALDLQTKTVRINRAARQVLLGGGTATISSTVATGAIDVALDDPTRVAARTRDDFLVLDEDRVVRATGGIARAVVGGGTTTPSLDVAGNSEADKLRFTSLVDVKFDPVLTVGGNPVAYAADAGKKVLWELHLGLDASESTKVKAFAIKLNSEPKSIAVHPDGSDVYILDTENKISKVTISTAGADATASVDVGEFGGARAIAVGKSGSKVQLFIAFASFVTVVEDVAAGPSGTKSKLFGVVDVNDLSVGDCGHIENVLQTGGVPPNGDPTPNLRAVSDAGNLTRPTWLSSDAAGSLYIADTGNNRIRKVAFNSKGAPTSINSLVKARPLDANPTVTVDSPQGVDVDEFGNVFICSTNFHELVVWRPCNGQYAEGIMDKESTTLRTGLLPIAGTGVRGLNFDNINALLVQLAAPKAVRVEKAADPISGPSRRRVYFIDQGNRVRMLSPLNSTTRRPANESLNAAAAPLCPPVGGGLADPYYTYIISTIAGAGEGGDGPNAAQAKLSGPSDLAIDKDGYVYVADGARIRRIDPVIGSISTVFTAPAGITTLSIDDVNKEIYFTLQGRQSVHKVFLGN